MPVLQDLQRVITAVEEIREHGARKEDVQAIAKKLDDTDVEVKALQVNVAKLNVKVALGASLGSLIGGGTVALIASTIGG